MTSDAPWITVAAAALYLTSGSSLPTNRKMRLPIGGNNAHARMVYRFLFPPAALGIPGWGACWPGGGGGICDINQSPTVGWLLRPDYRRNPPKTPNPQGSRNDATG